jgi:hypothetical protein
MVPLLFSAEERKEQVQSNVQRRGLERQQGCHPSWQTVSFRKAAGM